MTDQQMQTLVQVAALGCFFGSLIGSLLGIIVNTFSLMVAHRFDDWLLARRRRKNAEALVRTAEQITKEGNGRPG